MAELHWPTADESRAVTTALNAALTAADDFTCNMHDLICLQSGELKDGAPPPTFADLGVLAQLVELAGLDVAQLVTELEQIKRVAAHAAYIIDTESFAATR